jgi:hypothetical protein
MSEYRAYTVGGDGRFIGYEPMVCASDDEAVEMARRLSKTNPIEVWSGSRLVTRVSQQTVTHEIHDGQMIAKLAHEQ